VQNAKKSFLIILFLILNSFNIAKPKDFSDHCSSKKDVITGANDCFSEMIKREGIQAVYLV